MTAHGEQPGVAQPAPILRSHRGAVLTIAEGDGVRIMHLYVATETYGPSPVCEPRPSWSARDSHAGGSGLSLRHDGRDDQVRDRGIDESLSETEQSDQRDQRDPLVVHPGRQQCRNDLSSGTGMASAGR